jgi:regulator of sigma E protease
MQQFQEVLIAIVSFIVLLGIMVVVHEFGHFAVAKFFKVRVEAFSVGFGPRLFGVKYGDTEYKVCLLPLGGFVKMTGETPGEEAESANDPGAFNAHPRWQRMLIGLAGPVANFILAFVVMTFYFNLINEVPADKTTYIEWVSEGSSAAQAGLQAGDMVRRFGDVDNPGLDQIMMTAIRNLNQTVPVTVERNGKTVQTSVYLPSGTKGKDFDLSAAGIYPQLYPSPIEVDQVAPNTPADQAGLRHGDQIVAVDGHVFHTVGPLLPYLQLGKGKPVTLTVVRNGATLPPMVVHPSIQDSAWRLGFLQAQPPEIPMKPEPAPFSTALGMSKDFCVENSTVILDVLGRIFSHPANVTQLSGPVGIARMAGQAAVMKGWDAKFRFGAMISLNLGILNLLPFPILDGGMIFLLLIESALRHDINLNLKERIYQAAFVVLVAFAAFIIFNDVTKLRH